MHRVIAVFDTEGSDKKRSSRRSLYSKLCYLHKKENQCQNLLMDNVILICIALQMFFKISALYHSEKLF